MKLWARSVVWALWATSFAIVSLSCNSKNSAASESCEFEDLDCDEDDVKEYQQCSLQCRKSTNSCDGACGDYDDCVERCECDEDCVLDCEDEIDNDCEDCVEDLAECLEEECDVPNCEETNDEDDNSSGDGGNNDEDEDEDDNDNSSAGGCASLADCCDSLSGVDQSDCEDSIDLAEGDDSYCETLEFLYCGTPI